MSSGTQRRRSESILSGEQRAKYGCILTFENEAGQVFVLHRTGPIKYGIREACAIALAHDETFRVVSFSTPQSIYTDLTGGRADALIDPPKSSLKASYSKAKPIPLPEIMALGTAGLREMIHPRLVRMTGNA